MLIVILFILSLPGVYLGKYLFGRWFNHVTIYTVIWFGLLFFYHLGYIKYYPLSFETWSYIILAYLSLIFGTITVFISRTALKQSSEISLFNSKQFKTEFINSAKLKKIIIFFSLIGIFSGLQQWYILIKLYGNIPSILLNGSEIYRMRVEEGIPGVIPYLQSFSYVGLFLSGLYGAKKKSIPLITVLPLFGVIVKELANFSRAGILLGFVLFLTTYILTKNMIVTNDNIKAKKNKSKNVAIIIVIVILLISSAVFIRAFRGTVESFSGSSKELSSLRTNLLISPSLYLYMSAHIGVFNMYLKVDEEKSEVFGKNTFLPIYNFIAKLNLVKHFKQYHRGYYIPVWTNTGTYLRELHSDFGIVGIILGPYLLGLFSTILIFVVNSRKNLFYLTLLVFLYVIIIFSFLVLISRLGVFYISLMLILFTIGFLQNKVLFFPSKPFK